MCSTSHTGLQAAFDADWQAGRITADSYLNGTEDGALAYKLLIQTGSKKEPFNYSQVSFKKKDKRLCLIMCLLGIIDENLINKCKFLLADLSSAGGCGGFDSPGGFLHLPDSLGQ